MAEASKREAGGRSRLLAVVAIELLGGLSGWLSNSGYGNGWFDALQKPSFMPPGWTFGVVWPILYALLGIALAMILAEPPSPRRQAGADLVLRPARAEFRLVADLLRRRTTSARQVCDLPHGGDCRGRGAGSSSGCARPRGC